jgi:hypothetical protein
LEAPSRPFSPGVRVIVIDEQFVADDLLDFSYFSLFYRESARLSFLKL